MAVRTPLKLDGSNNLIEMNSTDIENIKLEMIRQYGLSPSVTLGVTTATGDLGGIADTRYTAGEYITNTTTYAAETTTPEPINITAATYNRITEVFTSLSAPADTNNRAFPIYYSGGNIYAMTLTDMYDTFVNDVIGRLTTQGTSTSQAGTYFISTATSVAGATLVSSTPVFTDTIADLAAYTAAGIPEALDQPVTVTNYYLHIINSASAGTVPTPLYITSSVDIQQYSSAGFSSLLQDIVQYYAANVVGSRVNYNLTTSTSGSRGSGMADTNHTGVTGNYQIRFVSSADYRAQEFPNGTVATITTTYLQCVRS